MRAAFVHSLQHSLHGLSGNVLQGVQVVAEVDLPKPANLDAQQVKVHRLLALEGLQDPGNLVSHRCTVQSSSERSANTIWTAVLCS